jgi:hypothetical protein
MTSPVFSGFKWFYSKMGLLQNDFILVFFLKKFGPLSASIEPTGECQSDRLEESDR